jgi:hypothetical protein
MRMLFLSLIAGLFAAPAQAADEKAVALVKEAIKAHGGEELLKKYKAGVMKVKGEMNVQGIDAEFDGTISYMLPDAFKLKLNMAIMGQKITFEQIAKGEKQKMLLNGMDFPIPDEAKDSIKSTVAEMEMNQLWPLLDDKKYEIKIGKSVDVNGDEADGIIVNAKDEKSGVKDVEMYFDKKTKLLVKTRKKDKEEGGKEVIEETFLTDYKEVQGIKTNMKSVVKHDGKPYAKFETESVTYKEKIEDSEFGVND